MPGFAWVALDDALAAHAFVIGVAGGDSGIRDIRLLESALDRARNKSEYEDAGLPECAAAYAFGIVKNHAFLDGSKRTALAVALLFLGLNGARLHATNRAAASARRYGARNAARGMRDRTQWVTADGRCA